MRNRIFISLLALAGIAFAIYLTKGNVGAPDPGGNYDDSCEDDIVFIPVPDGLFFMIFLSFLYAVWKIISFQRKKYLIF